MYIKKRAQSEIITTVLIILLVLAAIVIVWQVVRSTVTTGANQITGGTDCITLGFEITGVQEGTATSGGNVTVKRTAGAGDLDKIKLIVNGIVNNTQTVDVDELESVTLTLIPAESILKTGDKIEIAAQLGTIGNNKVCNTAASKTV